MRIKEEFKKSGYFWRPSEPDRKLPGALSISDGGHIELEVIGRFGGRIEVSLNAELNPIERIVGYIEKDEFVTLDDCYYKTLPLSLMGGISKSLIHVGKVFTGIGYDEGEIPRFNSVTFSVEGLDELKGKLRYGNEVSLRHRLKKLIESFEDVIEDWQKPKGLIDKIVNTRNYLTHYDLSLESKAAKAEELWPLCRKMELLFQLHFLQLIGFSREQIDSLLADSIPLRRRSQSL